MTSIASESVATILCTSKQTRFNIQMPSYRDLEVDGLHITVTSGEKAGAKGKSKARSEGTEILANSKLRLKAGQRYALVGRNGSGKSTLLKAIAEKLIPGIPEETRVVILQQTDASNSNPDDPLSEAVLKTDGSNPQGPSVLEHVIEEATARSDIEQEIRALSAGVNDTDPLGPMRAIRTIRHERNQKRLFLLDKNARLRSGARGMAARKALTAFEKEVDQYKALIEQPGDEISVETLEAETEKAIDMLADLRLEVESAKVSQIESKAKRILTGLGFSEAYMTKPVTSLSGGWKMRTALSIALLHETDILILDEPTNFLDLAGIIWLQRYLELLDERNDAPTLILVSHDRDFTTLCSDLLILKDKKLTYFHGNLPAYESSQLERKTWLTKMKEAQNKQKDHIQQSISNSIKAGKANDDQKRLRQAKSRQKKLDERWGLEVNAKGGRFKLNRDLTGHHFTRRADIDVPKDERPVSFVLPEAPDLRFPGPLISVENATFKYPTKSRGKTPAPVVLQDINLSVHVGDRIGIVGLNGAGKSTLIRLLVRKSQPSSGAVTTHSRLKLAYYSQHAVETLQAMGQEEPTLTALSLLIKEVDGALDEGQLRGLLGGLGLPGRVASDIPVRKLSGGQLVRCELARLLWNSPHCLVLDEVTTHLDYETVAAMREVLRDWEGAVVLVSHDRWFMRGVVEGMVDDSDSQTDLDLDDETQRTRVVYMLRARKMTLLENGVTEFEEGVEKKVKKLLEH
ncbi:ABC transporter [Ilyonectria destructans]|nr:ABC transporter [Ilyonectria destructans]